MLSNLQFQSLKFPELLWFLQFFHWFWELPQYSSNKFSCILQLGKKVSVIYNKKKLDSKFSEIFTGQVSSLPSHHWFRASVETFLAEWDSRSGIWTVGGVERREGVTMLETKSSAYHFVKHQPKSSLGSSNDSSIPRSSDESVQDPSPCFFQRSPLQMASLVELGFLCGKECLGKLWVCDTVWIYPVPRPCIMSRLPTEHEKWNILCALPKRI